MPDENVENTVKKAYVKDVYGAFLDIIKVDERGVNVVEDFKLWESYIKGNDYFIDEIYMLMTERQKILNLPKGDLTIKQKEELVNYTLLEDWVVKGMHEFLGFANTVSSDIIDQQSFNDQVILYLAHNNIKHKPEQDTKSEKKEKVKGYLFPSSRRKIKGVVNKFKAALKIVGSRDQKEDSLIDEVDNVDKIDSVDMNDEYELSNEFSNVEVINFDTEVPGYNRNVEERDSSSKSRKNSVKKGFANFNAENPNEEDKIKSLGNVQINNIPDVKQGSKKLKHYIEEKETNSNRRGGGKKKSKLRGFIFKTPPQPRRGRGGSSTPSF